MTFHSSLMQLEHNINKTFKTFDKSKIQYDYGNISFIHELLFFILLFLKYLIIKQIFSSHININSINNRNYNYYTDFVTICYTVVCYTIYIINISKGTNPRTGIFSILIWYLLYIYHIIKTKRHQPKNWHFIVFILSIFNNKGLQPKNWHLCISIMVIMVYLLKLKR
eukprot:165380_1